MDHSKSRHLEVIDSHTAGEPTRAVLPTGYAPDLGSGTLAERFERLRTEFDHLRRAILCEPRGSEVLVGAWLLAPDTSDCAAAVIFFNNAGYLGMCGHGTIGVAVTLAHIGRIGLGEHRIQTPVGIVPFELHSAHEVTIRNVPAYRHRKALNVDVPGYGSVTGDVAWGGNWFFLVGHHGCKLEKAAVDELTAFSRAIRSALGAQGVTGTNGAEIDHIELVSDVPGDGVSSRNFVLCPGGEYDRSPCGTGTSAQLACLAADGKLEPGQKLLQEGILGNGVRGPVRNRRRRERGKDSAQDHGLGIHHSEIDVDLRAVRSVSVWEFQLDGSAIRRGDCRRRHCRRGVRGCASASGNEDRAGRTRCAGRRRDGSRHGPRGGDGRLGGTVRADAALAIALAGFGCDTSGTARSTTNAERCGSLPTMRRCQRHSASFPIIQREVFQLDCCRRVS